MRCIDSLVNSATIILPMDTELIVEDILKLVSNQVKEISNMCFVGNHKNKTLDMAYKK